MKNRAMRRAEAARQRSAKRSRGPEHDELRRLIDEINRDNAAYMSRLGMGHAEAVSFVSEHLSAGICPVCHGQLSADLDSVRDLQAARAGGQEMTMCQLALLAFHGDGQCRGWLTEYIEVFGDPACGAGDADHLDS